MSTLARLAIIGLATLVCLAVLVIGGAGGAASPHQLIAGFAAGLAVPAVLIIANLVQRAGRRRHAPEFRGDQISGDYP
ncbi:hypothetical protein ACERNI_08500 [Camelimonas sp. ID_303_24]